MVEDTHTGIVLRVTAPYRHTITLFDERYGKIHAVAQGNAHSLMHGELISYKLEPWKHMHRLSDVQALKLPAAWVCNDILFLHHLLEMALNFLPEQSCAKQLFALCALLYEAHNQEILDYALLKKIFLGKFFAFLGVYPPHALKNDVQLFHLFSGSQEPILLSEHNKLQSIDELHEKLQHWLLGCIQTHPHANTFTTMQFFYAQAE